MYKIEFLKSVREKREKYFSPLFLLNLVSGLENVYRFEEK